MKLPKDIKLHVVKPGLLVEALGAHVAVNYIWNRIFGCLSAGIKNIFATAVTNIRAFSPCTFSRGC